MTRRALVLGAGEHAANAWELVGSDRAADEGIDVRGGDLFVGTSAGSRVAVQITSGLPLEVLFSAAGRSETTSAWIASRD